MRVITDPFAVNGGARIEFDTFDGMMFADRPGSSWPASVLRGRPDNKAVTINADGDLIDSENVPEDTSAAELSAFIEYALSEGRGKIDELLTIEQRKQAGWPEPYVIAGEVGELGDRLYWSNDFGWVDRESATVFTEAVRDPLGATGRESTGGSH